MEHAGERWYVARDDETPRDIAEKLAGVRLHELVEVNKLRHRRVGLGLDGLLENSELHGGTALLLPPRETHRPAFGARAGLAVGGRAELSFGGRPRWRSSADAARADGGRRT